jgi:hypothetical protein
LASAPRPDAPPAYPSCWASPRLAGKPCDDKGGRAVVAAAPIAAGELLAIFGGAVLDDAALEELSPDARRRVLQVDDGLFLYSEVESIADWVNHCCEPNAGISGQVALVALRPIGIGEEVCYDYAMSDGSPYDRFACRCGATTCRGDVTGDDWRIEALWVRYRGHFSPYLAARIARLEHARPVAVRRARRPRARAATG